MDQKEYRRMFLEEILQPLLINMVMEGILEEFEMEEDEADDKLATLKIRTQLPEDLEDVTVEEIQEARKQERSMRH